jgi:hypothetical protein
MRLLHGAAEGVVVGPITSVPAECIEAIVSWQAQAPEGTQLEVGLRVRIDGRWSRWWTMGLWSSEASYRGSVSDQEDAYRELPSWQHRRSRIRELIGSG